MPDVGGEESLNAGVILSLPVQIHGAPPTTGGVVCAPLKIVYAIECVGKM